MLNKLELMLQFSVKSKF